MKKKLMKHKNSDAMLLVLLSAIIFDLIGCSDRDHCSLHHSSSTRVNWDKLSIDYENIEHQSMVAGHQSRAEREKERRKYYFPNKYKTSRGE